MEETSCHAASAGTCAEAAGAKLPSTIAISSLGESSTRPMRIANLLSL
jgi:hypothetical protein